MRVTIPARSMGEASTRELTEKRFPCAQCGAVLYYKIGTRNLECRYCGHTNQIARSLEPIRELDLHRALRELQNSSLVEPEISIISCPNCAADFALDTYMHSGECPFCSTTVITQTGESRPIKPKALLPFAITADQARDAYQRWLRKLWFAPSELKKYARDDTRLNGVYIPYWTYDSDTITAYDGERGDVYYIKERYTTRENGRTVRRTRTVAKVRWSRVSGRTQRHFDDVLVGATRTLPRKITDWLEPWDLNLLEPYTEAYLSGFSSEVYQVNLDEGFNVAQSTMERVIRNDVVRSIGGDQQRIRRMNTSHSETTFKHVLLPLWSAAFQFRKKTYRFVVNGRSGKTRGERPYSAVKIFLAVVLGLAVVGVALYFAQQSGAFGGSGEGFWPADSFDSRRNPSPQWREYRFPEAPDYRF